MPYQRANVDQVPLPFVNDMDTTYEQKGAKRVAINQNGPTLAVGQAAGDRAGVLPTGAACRRVHVRSKLVWFLVGLRGVVGFLRPSLGLA